MPLSNPLQLTADKLPPIVAAPQPQSRKQKMRRLTRAPMHCRKLKPDGPPPEPRVQFKVSTLRLDRLHCTRCHYTWIPRRYQLPKVCPVCKNVQWHIPYGLKHDGRARSGKGNSPRYRQPTERKKNLAITCDICMKMYKDRGVFATPPLNNTGTLPDGYELIDHTR